MSRFGARLVYANQVVDDEFGDTFLVRPMAEPINESPVPDPSRVGGTGRGILKAPGATPGSDGSLRGLHRRSTAEITLFFMARGVMARLQRPDQITVLTSHFNPELIGRTFELADGPRPRGFGRFEVRVLSIPGSDEMAAPAPVAPRPVLLIGEG